MITRTKCHAVTCEEAPGGWYIYKCKQCAWELHYNPLLPGREGFHKIWGDINAAHRGSWSECPENFSAEMKVSINRKKKIKGQEN